MGRKSCHFPLRKLHNKVLARWGGNHATFLFGKLHNKVLGIWGGNHATFLFGKLHNKVLARWGGNHATGWCKTENVSAASLTLLLRFCLFWDETEPSNVLVKESGPTDQSGSRLGRAWRCAASSLFCPAHCSGRELSWVSAEYLTI